MPTDLPAPDAWPRPRPYLVIALLCVYAMGLLRDLDQPFVGMQDWNGAFFSYVSRNLLRYPLSVTHGLPVVEMGAVAPPADHCQRYATHPPGLPWMLAGVFAVAGVSEASARLLPIVCSLAALWLFMRLTAAALGRATALLAGLIYALMPMAVFFGRMVDHEAVLLFLMMLACWGWYGSLGLVPTSRSRRTCRWVGWAAVAAAVWVDWPGCLLAAALWIDAWVRYRRGACAGRDVFIGAIVPGVTAAAALVWLVYGGMDGSWAALRDMAMSRSAATAATESGAGRAFRDISMRGGAMQLTLDNFTLPLLALAAVGLVRFASLLLRRPARVAAAGGGAAIEWAGAPRTFGPPLIWTAVGGAWLALFHPQFIRHNYWQFYLGPTAALCAALGLRLVHEWLRDAIERRTEANGRSTRIADVAATMLLTTVVIAELRGTEDYFQRRSFSPERVRALMALTAQLGADEGVLLFENIVDHDRRGVYRYRNLVPPQIPYYLDRPAVVARDRAAVEQFAPHASVLLILGDLVRPGSPARVLLDELGGRYPQYLRHPYIIIDLKSYYKRIYGDSIGP